MLGKIHKSGASCLGWSRTLNMAPTAQAVVYKVATSVLVHSSQSDSPSFSLQKQIVRMKWNIFFKAQLRLKHFFKILDVWVCFLFLFFFIHTCLGGCSIGPKLHMPPGASTLRTERSNTADCSFPTAESYWLSVSSSLLCPPLLTGALSCGGGRSSRLSLTKRLSWVRIQADPNSVVVMTPEPGPALWRPAESRLQGRIRTSGCW